MNKKQLTTFNTAALRQILEQFGNNGHIFNSEAQFQFELAWKIRELFECEVKLEELSRIEQCAKLKSGKYSVKKDYTDIILEKGGVRIAIELKYKTALVEDLSLSNHGAVDLGTYDFMWDIKRLQTLTDKNDVSVKKHCTRGYAVILTNDCNYWRDNVNNENRIHRDFVFCEGNSPLTKGEHQWYLKDSNEPGSPGTVKDSFRDKSIILRKDYPYKWLDYCNLPMEKNGVFKFMIVEVC